MIFDGPNCERSIFDFKNDMRLEIFDLQKLQKSHIAYLQSEIKHFKKISKTPGITIFRQRNTAAINAGNRIVLKYFLTNLFRTEIRP